MNNSYNLIYIYSFSKNISGLYELYENDIFKQKDEQLLLNKILMLDIKILGYDNQVILLE